jgi:hypothetical protein
MQAIRAGVVELARLDDRRAGRGGDGCGCLLPFLFDNDRRPIDRDAEEERLRRVGELDVDAEIADLEDVAFAEARGLDGLAIDVRPGDRAFVGDEVARGVAFDDRVTRARPRGSRSGAPDSCRVRRAARAC